MFTYSGQSVDIDEGTPTSQDVAITLGRIPRLCGAARVWWSYLHHAAALMEIALWENEHYKLDDTDVAAQALIRDAHAAVTVLWEPARMSRDTVQRRIHEEWGVSYPHLDSQMRELIDRASARTLRAEVFSFAPEGMTRLPIFDEPDQADNRVLARIWDVRHSPESTALISAEAVLAYESFFDKPSISDFRRRFGYLKGAYDETRYPTLFKKVEIHNEVVQCP